MQRDHKISILVLLWGLLIILLTVIFFSPEPESGGRKLRALENDPADAGPCPSLDAGVPLLPAIVVVSASPDQVLCCSLRERWPHLFSIRVWASLMFETSSSPTQQYGFSRVDYWCGASLECSY